MLTSKIPVTCVPTIVHTLTNSTHNRYRELNNPKHSSANVPQPQLHNPHLRSPPTPMETTLSSTKSTYLLTHPAPTGLCYNTLITNAMIFHPTSPTPLILLLKRAPDDAAYPTVYEIPSGQIEDRDDTIYDGLERIVRQETRLEIECVEGMLGSTCYAVEKGVWNGEEEIVVWKLSLQLNFVCRVVDEVGRVYHEETSEGFWVPWEEVGGLDMTGEMRGVVESAFRWREGEVGGGGVEEGA